MERTLVIHPKDNSTEFLHSIYKDIVGATVITGDTTKADLKDLIVNHDRTIMLGHGSAGGLFGIGFGTTYIIDSSMVEFLRKQHNNIYIWCNADMFVRGYRLYGIYSGMFISEAIEAIYCGVQAGQRQIAESNDAFGKILGDVMEYDSGSTYRKLVDEYSEVASINRVAKYNCDLLHLR